MELGEKCLSCGVGTKRLIELREMIWGKVQWVSMHALRGKIKVGKCM